VSSQPEALFRYSCLLAGEGRPKMPFPVVETALNLEPENVQLRSWCQQLRRRIEVRKFKTPRMVFAPPQRRTWSASLKSSGRGATKVIFFPVRGSLRRVCARGHLARRGEPVSSLTRLFWRLP